MKKKILISYKIPSVGFDVLGDNFEVIFPKDDQISDAELNEHIETCDAIVSVFGHQLSNEHITRASKLKLIANFGVGYDNIDIPFVSNRGITVTNTPDPVTEPTAELAMGLMVAVARKIGALNNQLRTADGVKVGVMKNLSTTLTGKTLGIVGMGAIGQALARRALAFGMHIIYHNRQPLPADIEGKYCTHRVPLETLLKDSDVVSLHTPLTTETKHLINFAEFNLMKNTAYIINTARGSVINQKALIAALQNKQIAGAGLDVFENEPHIPRELLTFNNVVATPHVGTATLETRKEMSILVSQIIRKFFTGELQNYIVNKNNLH
ncbi:NAD(P)-dependent oxidoreductase [Saccharicrinis fermentans]|uniref:Putative 2-hydroxyacid dehydrogenase n=1 Tax=Saccharicrinis fermentans DSM 9555 = JCM 21142 TaxID=869213 RepID=W7YCA0_9BACT|nr:NAD(P)-dependent oxidoreductase [Saccharicrinis fermentans]GAF05088.1 putative 2-hydroxyacid dehydrogenase [Saccharicrinis fermentans DSM 9555 = JCM 21142]